MELYLALFGYDGWSYDLTFDDVYLPATFRDVRRLWERMLYRMRKRHPEPIDYVYRIEGLHGDHRYHIHLTVRYSDFPPIIMENLWPYGYVSGAPLLCLGRDPYDTYRRTAKYYCKERTDGIKIPVGVQPWVASRHCGPSCRRRNVLSRTPARSTSRRIAAYMAAIRWTTPSGITPMPGGSSRIRCIQAGENRT